MHVVMSLMEFVVLENCGQSDSSRAKELVAEPQLGGGENGWRPLLLETTTKEKEEKEEKEERENRCNQRSGRDVQSTSLRQPSMTSKVPWNRQQGEQEPLLNEEQRKSTSGARTGTS